MDLNPLIQLFGIVSPCQQCSPSSMCRQGDAGSSWMLSMFIFPTVDPIWSNSLAMSRLWIKPGAVPVLSTTLFGPSVRGVTCFRLLRTNKNIIFLSANSGRSVEMY